MFICSGYMPPEYVRYGRFSLKSDVFSFGVLVLEIVSGTKISSFRKGESEEGLISYVSTIIFVYISFLPQKWHMILTK
jgi:serine/threonine protein kinase